MKKLLIFIVGIVLPILYSNAQSTIRPLKIGEKVPDVVLSNTYNSALVDLRLSFFQNKIIILDFWSSWCGNCIKLFTHLDSLQRKFGSNLQIILVNSRSKESNDDEKKIKKIITSLEKRTGQSISLPVVYNCDSLDLYFPNKYIPHEVWLDENKKVIAITSWMEVTEQNISALLNNQPVSLHTKEDVLDYNKDKPLFVDNNGGNGDDFTGRSIVTGYKEGIFGIVVRNSQQDEQKVTGLSFLNNPKLTMLETAYTGTGKLDFAKNRWLYNVKDRKQFDEHTDSSFYSYLYCYDISIPPTSMENLRKYIREDLKRFFNLTAHVEKRNLSCYILKHLQGKKIISSKKNKEDVEYQDGSLKKYLHFYPFSEIVKFFDLRLDKPLLNETTLPQTLQLDIELPNNLTDQQGLLQSLKNAGFEIGLENRRIDVVIISDR
ncbi:MAG: TlpA disulfide reductase family protein [Chitinophagaceae bacterium]